MLPRLRNVADAAYGLLLGAVLVWMALTVTQRDGAGQAIAVSAALVAVAALLAVLGAATGALMDWPLSRGNTALNIGLGQCVLMAWFAWRSLLARGAQGLGWSVPGCGDVELLAVALLLIGTAARRGRMGMRPSRSAVPVFVLSIVAAVAMCELPRTISLSSDPDQHAFFAQQLLNLGRIPWHQASWGPLDFQYPAGLALLGRVWMLGGAVNAVEAVMVQPLVQSLLAVAALGIWFGQARADALSRESGGWWPRALPLLGAVVACSLFFALLPFSMLSTFALLEKTGSLSSLLLLVLVAALLLQACQPASPRGHGAAWGGCAVVLGLTALVNPVALLVPMAAALVVLVIGRLQTRQPVASALGISVLLFALLLLSDPYYLNRFVFGSVPKTLDVPPGFESGPAVPPLAEALQYLSHHMTSLAWLKPWGQAPYLGDPLIAVGILLAGLFALSRAPRAWRGRALAVALGVPVGCTLLGLLLLPLFHRLRHRGDLYLLEPYLTDAIARAAYLWLFAVLLFTLVAALSRLRWRGAACRAVPVLALLAVLPVAALRDMLPTDVRMQSRADRCGDTPCDVAEDLRLIQDARPLLRAGPDGALARILVPNRQLDIGRERWLLPVGFARALPVHLDAPLAFFYGKGDADFTRASYDEHVCRRLDTVWLHAHRVAYLFLPSNRAGACVAGLAELLDSDRVVLRRGRAALIRL